MEKAEVTYLIIAGTAMLILLGIFIIFLIWNYYKRNTAYRNKVLLIEHQKQQAILQAQIEIQEQTLKNVSQELHDNIGQVLSLVKLNINTMIDTATGPLYEKINDSKELITQAIQDLRNLSRTLNTDYIMEMGLISLIKYELELLKKSGKYQTHLNIEGTPFIIEKQKELILFRILQEIVHNIIKHAKASVIDIHIKFDHNLFSFTIIDNGSGFDASQLEQNSYSGLGLGIRNMNNRAKLINGNFRLTSSVGKGTKVILTLPNSIKMT